MCLETKKIIKSQDVIFVENKQGYSYALEMCRSESNEEPMIEVNKFSNNKVLFEDNKDYNETPLTSKEKISSSLS